MGILDNLISNVRNQGNDDYYDEDDYEFEEEAPSRKRSFSFMKKNQPEDDGYYDDEEPVNSGKRNASGPIRTGSNTGRGLSRSQFNAAEGMEARVVKPASFAEAKEITDILLSGRMVLLNIEGLNPEVAQRVVDFVSGSCYALNGNYEKISEYVHVITPSNVGISGDFHGTIPAGTFGAFQPAAPAMMGTQSMMGTQPMMRSDLPFGG